MTLANTKYEHARFRTKPISPASAGLLDFDVKALVNRTEDRTRRKLAARSNIAATVTGTQGPNGSFSDNKYMKADPTATAVQTATLSM
jgi:hypothetical protein